MIITIASFKGGVGKSTLALNLAQYLATRQKAPHVVLSDGDPNKTCWHWYKRSSSAKFECKTGDKAPGKFGHLVIDTPARTPVSELLPLANGSDLLLIPTSIEPFALEATTQTLSELGTLPKDKFAVVLTMVNHRAKRKNSEARTALEGVGAPVLFSTIARRAIHPELSLTGKALNTVKTDVAKDAWKEVSALGREIMRGWGS